LLSTIHYTLARRHGEAIYRFKVGMLPSDFFRRNVVLSFQQDAIGIRLLDGHRRRQHGAGPGRRKPIWASSPGADQHRGHQGRQGRRFRVGVIGETFDAAHPVVRHRAIRLETSRNRAIRTWSRPDLGSGHRFAARSKEAIADPAAKSLSN
jgi:hypothetical protein